jgi:hypothetical protein
MPIVQTRRRLVTNLSNLAFAGATGLGGAGAARCCVRRGY